MHTNNWQMAAHEHTQHTGKVGYLFSFFSFAILCVVV